VVITGCSSLTLQIKAIWIGIYFLVLFSRFVFLFSFYLRYFCLVRIIEVPPVGHDSGMARVYPVLLVGDVESMR